MQTGRSCDITDYIVKNHGCLKGSFCKREFVFRWRCVAMQVCVSIDWLAMSERQVRHRFAFGQGQVCAEDLLQEVARLRWSGQQRVAAYRSHSTVTAGAAFATSAGLRSVVVLLMLFACFIWGGGGCVQPVHRQASSPRCTCQKPFYCMNVSRSTSAASGRVFNHVNSLVLNTTNFQISERESEFLI